MRSSMIRIASAIVTAALLAACGGHGVVPQQNVVPSNGVSGDVSSDAFGIDAKTSPCDVPGMYYFHGSCVPFNLNMNANTTVTLGKFKLYEGLKISTTLSAFDNPPKGVKTVAAVMGDAIGKNNDITGTVKNKAFPLYVPGKPGCINNQNKPELCPGRATFVYAELINSSKYTLKPKNTPAFFITDKNGFPGKNLCYPAILTSKGWAPNQTLGGKPSGDTLRIGSTRNPGQLVFAANGQFIVAGVCQ